MPGLMAVALSALLAVAAPCAVAQPVSDAEVERLGGLLVEMMPIGEIFDQMTAADPAWPLGAAEVAPEQLACMRSELSSDGYLRAKLTDARAYATDNRARVASDIALLEQGASMLFGQLVKGGADPAVSDTNAFTAATLGAATPNQLLSMMTVITDPKHAALREAAGIGDAIDVTQSPQANEKNGFQLGVSIVTQLMIKSMDTCKVPTSAILG
jgi:hypothetical protein